MISSEELERQAANCSSRNNAQCTTYDCPLRPAATSAQHFPPLPPPAPAEQVLCTHLTLPGVKYLCIPAADSPSQNLSDTRPFQSDTLLRFIREEAVVVENWGVHGLVRIENLHGSQALSPASPTWQQYRPYNLTPLKAVQY
ncbi:hypothetical protein J1605_004614 [Eschrichtius robustus]|uniref:Uncharacterized protein n=1 Tax=Eschrichtius robustus TaxID=9764 RepID=A0AB34HI23_ESCRO|nr:hypothetical protein J1605_004614 [Eschrichtius robustus]